MLGLQVCEMRHEVSESHQKRNSPFDFFVVLSVASKLEDCATKG